MKPLGNQHIAEFINCSSRLLNNKVSLEKMFKDGINAAGMELVTIISYKFNPIGVTVIAIIGESHIAMHTYPEAKHVSLDVFTCSGTTAGHYILLNYFKSKLQPKTTRYLLVERGNPIDVKQAEWTSSFSSYGFEVKYHIRKRLVSKKSKYQQIDIIENENFGRMLFLDKDLQIAESDTGVYDQAIVAPVVKGRRRPKFVCILGGGDGGVLHAIQQFKPSKVWLVDIDADVVKYSKKYLKKICKNSFSKKNVKIVIADVNVFLQGDVIFDTILYDLTMHPETSSNFQRTKYLKDLFTKIEKTMSKNGMISMQCCSEHDLYTQKLLRRILPLFFKKIKFSKIFIPSFCEWWIFAVARKK